MVMATDVFVSGVPKSLSKEDRMNYFRRYKDGDLEARDKLISHNIKLVINTAWKFSRDPGVVEEYISIGLYGLIKAVDTFDIDRGKQFSTYAVRCISNEILMFIRKSKHIQEKNLSLNAPIDVSKKNEEDILYFEDVLEDDTFDMVSAYEEKESSKLLKEAVVSLPDREFLVVTRYYGMFGYKVWMQYEMADELNISQAQISRILKRSLQYLKKVIVEVPNNKKRKGKRPETIFSLLKEYKKEDVIYVLNGLSEDEQILVKLRYGENLARPVTSPLWNKHTSKRFYYKLLPKIRQQLELNQMRENSLGTVKQLSREEQYDNDRLTEIHGYLVGMDFMKAQVALHAFLEYKGLLRFERFIGNLIILSFKQNDTMFVWPIRNLIMLVKGVPFNVDSYKEYFYEALKLDLDEAKLYLEIITCLNKEQDMGINVDSLEKTYNLYLERKLKEQ